MGGLRLTEPVAGSQIQFRVDLQENDHLISFYSVCMV